MDNIINRTNTIIDYNLYLKYTHIISMLSSLKKSRLSKGNCVKGETYSHCKVQMKA